MKLKKRKPNCFHKKRIDKGSIKVEPEPGSKDPKDKGDEHREDDPSSEGKEKDKKKPSLKDDIGKKQLQVMII